MITMTGSVTAAEIRNALDDEGVDFPNLQDEYVIHGVTISTTADEAVDALEAAGMMPDPEPDEVAHSIRDLRDAFLALAKGDTLTARTMFDRVFEDSESQLVVEEALRAWPKG